MGLPVNMIAPDGSPVNTDSENVESLIADGYKLADQEHAPAASPSMPPPSNGPVNLIAPDGSAVNADAEHVDSLLQDGYKVADQGVVRKQQQAAEYGDTGSQIAAGLEGAAQGATLGAYGAVSSLVSPEYERERRLRAEHNPGTALAGELVGSVAPALLSGGTGALGTAARVLPSALEANLGAKMATWMGGKAAGWTASKAAQVGIRMGTLGLEGASDQAVRTVLDDAANGDVEVTAERMLDSAWKGFAAGAALELGGAAFSALGKGVARGARAIGDKLPTMSDAAGEAAYKAAVGRTDVRSQRLAQRFGGSAEVGKTLLEKGLVTAGDTVDDIAERLPGAREAAGQQLGTLLEEVAGGTASKTKLKDEVEAVISRFDKPGQEDVADALRRKVEASGIERVIAPRAAKPDSGLMGTGAAPADEMPLTDLLALRRTIDSRADLKWGSAGPNGVDLTTEGMRDIRNALEREFESASDAFAKSSGVADFGTRLKQAKREYSHLALAADQAEEGVFRRAANNKMGLTDTLAGVGGAAALGPMGAAASLASRFARERFDSTAASLLHRASARPTLLNQLADDAVRTQEQLVKHADETVKAIFSPEARAVAKTSLTLSANSAQRALQRAVALQDPNSPESQSFAASVRHVGQEDPALAQALAQKVQVRASFLASKVPPKLDPRDPLHATPGRLDGATARKSQRYVEAALDPQAALKRLSQGAGTPEDIETLRALTPRLYQVYVKRVQERMFKQKAPPTMRQRQRLAYATGMPMSASDSPDMIAWFQSIKVAPEPQPSPNPNLAPVQPGQQPQPSTSDRAQRTFATRTDSVLAGE